MPIAVTTAPYRPVPLDAPRKRWTREDCAALEAMACGVATVGTNVGGVPELIIHGENGFMEAVGDIAAQSARVVSLLTDDALHQCVAAAGRRRAMEQFSTEKIIPQYERYYEDVLGRS